MHELAYLLKNSHELGFDKGKLDSVETDHIKNLESDFYKLIKEALKRCRENQSSNNNELKKEADICCENLLKYFSNHEDNWFAKASYSVLPRCLEMSDKDRKIAVDI